MSTCLRLPVIVFQLLVLALMHHTATAAERGGASPNTREAQLVQSLLSINSNELDVALKEVDTLLKATPNFKLAQLVRGDLLMARAQPLSDIGNMPGASREQMEDLRDEARVRLKRIQDRPITLAPKYLWQLDANQRYAIVVDTSKSTLYLYQNVNGEARYVNDFYVSIGKLGAAKIAEGDQKTPLGVYFVSASLPKKSLTDFYGSGAYPLNYPNEWDRKQGRDGHGIWLHGTPSDTYSRPPRSSNGCIVLSNEDLNKLSKVLQIGVTPVIITNGMDSINAQDQTERAALLQSIEAWRADWASINTNAYLKHYARDFSSSSANFSSWSQQKKQVNAGKSWIKVHLSKLSIFTYPEQPNMAVVNFEQDYSSNNLSNRMKKRQYWMKRDNRWQIIYEGAA
ncbi:MAG: L,D-transpeptidase family protein [Gallionellaceae bacterium]|nr:L,D-transpeptidase family protein [Gallionellaceae bacterium]